MAAIHQTRTLTDQLAAYDAKIAARKAAHTKPDQSGGTYAEVYPVQTTFAVILTALLPIHVFFRILLIGIVLSVAILCEKRPGCGSSRSSRTDPVLEDLIREREILAAGVSGERFALAFFSRLPDTFHIFPNLHLRTAHGANELDLLIAGPSGLHIVEVKNCKGILTGDWEAPQLCQNKHGYTKLIRNPKPQVQRHAQRLQMFLRENRLPYIPIHTHVFFVSPDLRLAVTGGRTDDLSVYTYETKEALLDVILGGETDANPCADSRLLRALCSQLS